MAAAEYLPEIDGMTPAPVEDRSLWASGELWAAGEAGAMEPGDVWALISDMRPLVLLTRREVLRPGRVCADVLVTAAVAETGERVELSRAAGGAVLVRCDLRYAEVGGRRGRR